MAVHAYHDALPGYDEGQIFKDGCPECEHRAQLPFAAQVATLDPATFARAWDRAWTKERSGLPTCSYAEVALLDGLMAVRVQLSLPVYVSMRGAVTW